MALPARPTAGQSPNGCCALAVSGRSTFRANLLACKAMPTKFCVFCGKRPEGKNKEHVLPRWLLELTGDPTRPANFGLDLSAGSEYPKLRQYAFSQFQFPACENCNQIYSALEGSAKVIVLKLLADEVATPTNYQRCSTGLTKFGLAFGSDIICLIRTSNKFLLGFIFLIGLDAKIAFLS